MGIDEICHKTIMAASLLGALLVSGCESAFYSAKPNTSISVSWKDAGGIVQGQLIYTNLMDTTDVTPVDINNKGDASTNLSPGVYKRSLALKSGKGQKIVYSDTTQVSLGIITYTPWCITQNKQLYKGLKSNMQDTAALLQSGVYKKPIYTEMRPDSSEYKAWKMRNPSAKDSDYPIFHRRFMELLAESKHRTDSVAAYNHRLDSLANHVVTRR